MDPFQVIPADVWGVILFDLHPRKLFRLCRVSKRARAMVHAALRYIIRRRCGKYDNGGVAEFRRYFQCGHPGCHNLDYHIIDGRCRGHQPKPVMYTPAGAIAATGGIFQLLTNDGRADRMLMATELLNQRIRQIEMMRARQHPDD